MKTSQLNLHGKKIKTKKIKRKKRNKQNDFDISKIEKCPICKSKLDYEEDCYREESIEFLKECEPEIDSNDYTDFQVLLFWHCENCNWQSEYWRG